MYCNPITVLCGNSHSKEVGKYADKIVLGGWGKRMRQHGKNKASTRRKEANIREGGKIAHVVFLYLIQKSAVEWDGGRTK